MTIGTNLKKLRQISERSDIDIWFEDECHFQQHGTRHVMWVPPEETDPIVLHAPTRKSAGIIGAVRSCDGKLVVAPASKFNAESFLDFLKQLICHKRKGRKMVVVLDNARWHHAKLLKAWIKCKASKLELIFLPPYSPDLNPIERVWKLTRRICTHNRYFPTFDELVDTVFDRLLDWEKPNEMLRRLCAIN